MKKIFLIAISAMTMVACRMEDNIDPNIPQTEDLSPRNLLAAAETTSYAAQMGSMYQLANIWTNTWAGNYYYYAAPMTREYQMDVTSTFYNGIWNSNYLAMANLAQIYNNKQASKYPLHSAIAKILMANSMQYIVDFYGDAPYTEAFKLQEMLTPRYDKGEDIYHDLVVKINEAIEAIDNTEETDANAVTAGEDVILNGDMAAWKKVANTIKLRLLLRQSKVTDGTISSFVNQQLATLTNASFITEDITIQPGYNAGTQEGMNPLYSNYGFYLYDQTRNNSGNRYIMISDHFAKLLKGDGSKPTAGVNDKRATKMYRAIGSTINGIVQGSVKPEGTSEGQYSRLGWLFNTGLEDGPRRDGYIFTYAESELQLAQAAVEYPQYFTNAKGHYDNAVRSSFVFYGLTDADATAYLAALDPKPVGWTGAPSKIAAIQYQRLVALNEVKPFETYINYLKTGYPETPLALSATKPNKPYRLVYPQSEYVGNSANVPNVTTNDIFVKNAYTPFWNRN